MNFGNEEPENIIPEDFSAAVRMKKEPNFDEIQKYVLHSIYPERVRLNRGLKKNFRRKAARFTILDGLLYLKYRERQLAKPNTGPELCRVIKERKEREKLLKMVHRGIGENRKATVLLDMWIEIRRYGNSLIQKFGGLT